MEETDDEALYQLAMAESTRAHEQFLRDVAEAEQFKDDPGDPEDWEEVSFTREPNPGALYSVRLTKAQFFAILKAARNRGGSVDAILSGLVDEHLEQVMDSVIWRFRLKKDILETIRASAEADRLSPGEWLSRAIMLYSMQRERDRVVEEMARTWDEEE